MLVMIAMRSAVSPVVKVRPFADMVVEVELMCGLSVKGKLEFLMSVEMKLEMEERNMVDDTKRKSRQKI